MRTQRLLQSLNDKNILGFSEDEISLFSQLTEEEIKELAAHRTEGKRTILHRILSTDRTVPLQNELFWSNLNKLFIALKDKLIPQDSERLTVRIVLNHNVSNIAQMVTAAKEVGIFSFFSDPKTVATHLSSSDYDTRRLLCQAKGLQIPSAEEVIKLSQRAKNLEAELDSARRLRSHAMSEVEAVTRQLDTVKNALQTAKKERDEVRKNYDSLQQQFNQASCELDTIKSNLSQSEEEKRQQQQKIQELQTRLRDLNRTLDKANKKAETLESELHTSLEETSKLERDNTELRTEYSEARRFNTRAHDQLSRIPEVIGLVQLTMQALQEVSGAMHELPEEDSLDSPSPIEGLNASSSRASSAGLFSQRKRTAEDAGLASSSDQQRRQDNPSPFSRM
ncbi:hypothetical protein [Legionella impletisoli]|uniref:Uncharacterized protein n=1 Tax=Legionella impletisoli TaxID=343510 RepID=A0A917JUH3_9GAMM|nr:hypothetical protein [Legionella impletisoli]GGI81933.1 hypothetical protein GCM10007966_08100 [Legionella impletisoli]